MRTIEYKQFDHEGYTYDFSPKSQGFQLTVTKDGETIFDYQMLMQTQFEALATFASEKWGEAVRAEAIAEAGNIPFRFWDDADCRDCDHFGDYSEMTGLESGEYLCNDCAAKMSVEDLLENAPSHAQGVADLYRWATNYDYQTGTPYWAFCDLIGYSDDQYGQKMNPAKFTLDYMSSDAFTAALNEWSNRPSDVTDFMDKLHAAE